MAPILLLVFALKIPEKSGRSRIRLEATAHS
jgi:hypothetical protein